MALEIIYTATDEIAVRDTDGGVWHPNEDTKVEIEHADDPEAKAIQICKTQPMRGAWHD